MESRALCGKELTKYDKRIIHYYELMMYYKNGGFSKYTVVNIALLLISVIIDVLIITGMIPVNNITLVLIVLANGFIFMKGPFLFINRNILYRIKNRIDLNLNDEEIISRKETGVFKSCRKLEEDAGELIVEIDGISYGFNVSMELIQRCKYIQKNDYVEIFFLNDNGKAGISQYVFEILNYKVYYQKYVKASKRNPKTNEKIKKEKRSLLNEEDHL